MDLRYEPFLYQITVHVNNYEAWKGHGALFIDLEILRKNLHLNAYLKQYSAVYGLMNYYGYEALIDFKNQFRQAI